MADSKIEWTDKTWNPVTGCTKVSQGCKFCYAETMTKRLQAIGLAKYADGFQVRLQPDNLFDPMGWKKPQMVFVNSMSDLYHESVPLEYIRRVFQTMNECPRHTFQVLTKRSERLSEPWFNERLNWTDNIWQGVSVESKDVTVRIDDLRKCGAKTKFLSLEPLLGPLLNLDLSGIEWVIVGGESGQNARPMKAEWVYDIRDQCLAAGVPFFFKQWGGRNKKLAGRLLDGRTWDQMPERTTL